MRKLTYEEKPRLTMRKVKDGYTLSYIGRISGRVWRGHGTTQLGAWYALQELVKGYNVAIHAAYIARDLQKSDIGLGPSDYHIATSNLPWWRRLFRI